MTTAKRNTTTRSGGRNRPRYRLSLLDLVATLLVLGIIAAAVAPRIFDTRSDRRDKTTEQNSAVDPGASQPRRFPNASSAHSTIQQSSRVDSMTAPQSPNVSHFLS